MTPNGGSRDAGRRSRSDLPRSGVYFLVVCSARGAESERRRLTAMAPPVVLVDGSDRDADGHDVRGRWSTDTGRNRRHL